MLRRSQVERVLITQDFLAALIDDALLERTASDSILDGGDFSGHVFGHEQHIVACQQGIDASRPVEQLGGTFHVQGISEDETLEVHMVSQQGGHAGTGEARRGLLIFNGGNEQVGGEDAAEAGIDKLAEG